MTRLAWLLHNKPGQLEADLQRYYQIDLRDLWRGDLTWRRICVLIRHLPAESDLGESWPITALLLSDVLAAWTGKHHPNDPRIAGSRRRVKAQVEDVKRRAEERRKALGINGSVLRKE